MDKEVLTIDDETTGGADTETTDAPSVIEGSTSLKQLDQRLSALQDLFDKQIARNQNQKQMFDTIYGEMKDYKESTLLEAFHKPIIHNLIQFYDYFVSVEAQLNRIQETLESPEIGGGSLQSGLLRNIGFEERGNERSGFRTQLTEEVSEFGTNLKNLRFALEEVLYRLDVTPYEEHPTKLDRKLHRTLDTTPTDNPDKDQEVATIHKIGFYWREKVFRPEEVTIFRYTQPTGEETVDGN